MADRRNRSRRRRRLRAKVEEVDTAEKASSSPQSSGSSATSLSSSSSSERGDRRKIPLPNRLSKEGADPRRRPRDASAVQPSLLSLIRGYYIDAISRLPANALRTTLARGLLVAGHCYGPLHPVHNIIVNAIWYAAAFPFRATDIDPIVADVISSDGISRLAHRSLDGLVASLRHHCPALSEDDALWHLCLSGAGLHGAAASVWGAVPLSRKQQEAQGAVPFLVAAKAAGHPKPANFARFVTSVLPDVERKALSLLTGKCRLSSPDILRLSGILLPCQLIDDSPPLPLPSPSLRERRQKIIRIITEKRSCCRRLYRTVLDIADAALLKFAHQTGARYRLLTTFGQCILPVKDRHLHQYFHINFLACPKGRPPSATGAPVRFFAEAYNPPIRNCSEEHITLCCMLVDTQPSSSHVGNCYDCVIRNQEIDHPNDKEHFGGCLYKKDEADKHRGWQSPTIDVDYRFFDPDRDIDLMESFADKVARAEAFRLELRSEREAIRSKLRSGREARIKKAGAPTRRKYHLFGGGDDSDDEDEDEDASDDVSIFCTRCM